jgi:hypothetical protein
MRWEYATARTLDVGQVQALRRHQRTRLHAQGGQEGRAIAAGQFAGLPDHACDIGLFQRLDHLFAAVDAELKAVQNGLAGEETNLTSYTDQFAGPCDHEEALLPAQRDLPASTAHSPTIVAGVLRPAPCPHAGFDDEAAA